MTKIDISKVDAILDRVDAERPGLSPEEWLDRAGEDLTALLDKFGGWEWEQDENRLAIVESTGAFWVVLCGLHAYHCGVWRCGTADEAEDKFTALREMIEGGGE